MNNLENNKIFAAVLVAGIVAMFCGFIATLLTPHQHLEKDAVTVEAAAGAAVGGPAAATVEPIFALLAAADVAKGEKIAKACAACHSFNKGGANGVGPNLWNTVGQKKEHAAGFAYSGELSKVGDPVWSYSSLNKFLWKPKTYAPATKMNYIGVKKPEDRAALIAYLRTLSDSPAALPSQAEIDKEAAELAPPVTEGETKAEEASEKPTEATKAEPAKVETPKMDVAPKAAPAQLIPQPVKTPH